MKNPLISQEVFGTPGRIRTYVTLNIFKVLHGARCEKVRQRKRLINETGNDVKKRYSIILAVGLFFILSVSAQASDWTKEDTYRELAFTAVLAIDYGQTMSSARHPEKYRENNPILGGHPSTTDVQIYMASAAIIHPIISYLLPPEYRRYWQIVSIGIEAGQDWLNASVGIKVDF